MGTLFYRLIRELRNRRKNRELRGVGKNMRDRYVARVTYPIVGAQATNERSHGAALRRWLVAT
jgi:hypothetical protein